MSTGHGYTASTKKMQRSFIFHSSVICTLCLYAVKNG